MKNMILFSVILMIAVMLPSCDMNNKSDNKSAGIVLSANDSIFSVNEGGYEFQIVLPKDLMISNAPEIALNSATGDLHIHVGEQFWIIVSQEKMDMAAIKTNINEDMLFTSKVIEETNNSILFQRILPDGMEYDFNYRCINEIGGKPYLFKTCEEGEFSMECVNRMKQAISSIHQTV